MEPLLQDLGSVSEETKTGLQGDNDSGPAGFDQQPF